MVPGAGASGAGLLAALRAPLRSLLSASALNLASPSRAWPEPTSLRTSAGVSVAAALLDPLAGFLSADAHSAPSSSAILDAPALSPTLSSSAQGALPSQPPFAPLQLSHSNVRGRTLPGLPNFSKLPNFFLPNFGLHAFLKSWAGLPCWVLTAVSRLGAWQTFLIGPLDVFATLHFHAPSRSACPAAYVITYNNYIFLTSTKASRPTAAVLPSDEVSSESFGKASESFGTASDSFFASTAVK